VVVLWAILKKAEMSKSKRVYQIDLFRFLAAVGVMLYHYTCQYRIAQTDGTYLRPFPGIAEVSKFGYLGVDLFFIISGFVIALSIQKASLIHFIKSRVTRLYPAYWFCLIVTFLVVLVWGGSKYSATYPQFFANATMLNGFFGVENIDGVYWSLYVELKFYLLMALYLLLRKIKDFKLEHFIVPWLTLSVFSVFIPFESSVVLRIVKSIFILDYSALFIAGMIYYKIYKTGAKPIYFAGLTVCLLVSITHGLDKLTAVEAAYDIEYSRYAIVFFLVLFNLLIYLSSIKKLQFINSPKLLKFGVLTYPLYLIHSKIGIIIFRNHMTEDNKYLLVTFVTLVMILAAYLINTYFEIPFSKKISGWLNYWHAKYEERKI